MAIRNSLNHFNKVRFKHDGIQYSASVHFYPVSYSSEVVKVFFIRSALNHYHNQRWSRGHKARKAKAKNSPFEDRPFRGQVRNARGQGYRASVLKKKVFKKVSGDLKKKKEFSGQLQKKVFKNFFQAICKIFTIQNIVLSSSRGQGNFQRLEASRPRPRSSKCVREDSTSDDNS